MFKDNWNIYIINSGLFIASSVNAFVDINKEISVLIISCCGFLQLIIGLLGREKEREELVVTESTNEIEDVKVDLKLWNLFKTFKSSLILILIYLFYCGIALDMEISHTFNFKETSLKFMVIPFVYAVVHSLLEITRKKVKDLNVLSIIILALQIACSIAEIVLNSYKLTYDLSFIFFVLNLVFFQKLVFINFIVSLLKIFDIKNVRICNYINCKLISHCQPDSVLC